MQRRGLKIPWGLSLLACPLAIAVLGTAYGRASPYSHRPGWPGTFGEPWAPPLPWASHAVDALLAAHLAASAVSSVALFWMARHWRGRLLGLATITGMVALGVLAWFGASQATTGVYL